MQYCAKKCYYWNPSTRLEGWTGKAEIFDKINQRLKKLKGGASGKFKKLVLETWKYDGLKDKNKEQKPSSNDLKGKDTDLTNRRNLGAYVTFTHLTALGATDLVNRKLGSLYNSWALNLGTDIHIYNDRNRFNYTITYTATALDVIDSSK